jgi:hypothetical protein
MSAIPANNLQNQKYRADHREKYADRYFPDSTRRTTMNGSQSPKQDKPKAGYLLHEKRHSAISTED